MSLLKIVLLIAGAVATSSLAILGLRGRFGTTAEQGRYELDELSRSKDVPRRARRRSVAMARGSTMPGRSLIGAGVLWLTDDTLGFVRRSPKRRVTIDVASIRTITVSPTYREDVVEETSTDGDFLIIGWDHIDTVASTIAFRVDDPEGWAAAIEAARSVSRGS